MQKRIIIEGMDSTGKSTLIERLQYEFHTLKPMVNTLGPEQDFDRWWPEVLDRTTRLTPIHDRFFYSELVYGFNLRGYVKATAAIQNQVVTRLRDEALLIYARPSNEAIMRTINNKPQMEGVTDKSQRLLTAYDELMWREQIYYGRRFAFYDWEKGSGAAIALVERYLLGELWTPTKTSTSTT